MGVFGLRWPARWVVVGAAVAVMLSGEPAAAAGNTAPPDVPTRLTVDSCYVYCESPAVVRSGTPTITALVRDPDGGTVTVEYEVFDETGTTLVARSGTEVTGVSSGTARGWAVRSLAGGALPNGRYEWRARACDSAACGGYSDWFAFTVDTRGLPLPTVSSTAYPESSTGTWSDGVGVPGQFAFGANGGQNVVEYIYQLNDGNAVTVPATADPTVVTIVPPRDGSNRLAVYARNYAGVTTDSRVYDFLVSPSDAAWRWTFDENAGTVAASAPAEHPAAFSAGGVSWRSPGRVGDAAVSLDGTGELSTASAVLGTAHPAGFTVAAYVRRADATGARTAISQDGANTSMFRLGFRDDRDVDGDGAADPAWCFSLANADSGDAGETAACVPDEAAAGDWVSLVGIYDRPTGNIRVYLNGGWQAVTPYAGGGWSATGPLAIGRAWQDGPTERWVGDIDEVRVAQRSWSAQEIFLFARQ